jgi:hypothetical protein
MNAEEARALLKERGISVMNIPHGYVVTVSKREGNPSRRIEIDEMDAILALGQIRLLAVEDTVGDILIEVIDRLMPEHQRQVVMAGSLIIKATFPIFYSGTKGSD